MPIAYNLGLVESPYTLQVLLKRTGRDNMARKERANAVTKLMKTYGQEV